MSTQKDQAIIDMVEKMKQMDMSSITLIKVGVDSLAAKERLDKGTCGEVQKTG
ncbi:MAG: hypothetical protein E6X19_00110 [Hungatella hathewayi]|uniref:hypothetical protein n=1 Tax=Blautia sp. TaxID=1955243 RepID=UPI00290D2519|nr:hypothetical protein [Hungatella hathewayi]